MALCTMVARSRGIAGSSFKSCGNSARVIMSISRDRSASSNAGRRARSS